MEFAIGYPAGAADTSDRFPCQDDSSAQFGIACFGLYFFETTALRALDSPQSRFTWKTDAYNGMPAGLLTTVKPNVIDNNPRPSSSRPDLEWSIRDFNGV